MIKSRRMRLEGHGPRMGEEEPFYVIGIKPEGKRPLGGPRRWCVDDIRMDLGEIEWGDVYWIDLVHDTDKWIALVTAVMNLRFYKMLGNYRVAMQLVASAVAFSSTELFSYV
jgi:hypothetical protein